MWFFAKPYSAQIDVILTEYRRQLDHASFLPGGPKPALKQLRRLRPPPEFEEQHNQLVRLMGHRSCGADGDGSAQRRSVVDAIGLARWLAIQAETCAPDYASAMLDAVRRTLARSERWATLVSLASKDALKALEARHPTDDLTQAHALIITSVQQTRDAARERFQAIERGDSDAEAVATRALRRSLEQLGTAWSKTAVHSRSRLSRRT